MQVPPLPASIPTTGQLSKMVHPTFVVLLCPLTGFQLLHAQTGMVKQHAMYMGAGMVQCYVTAAFFRNNMVPVREMVGVLCCHHEMHGHSCSGRHAQRLLEPVRENKPESGSLLLHTAAAP